jgi:predicted signal transduction protein with EAL and GGDEF domain
MPFQPIIDLTTSRVWAYEALVREPEGQSAFFVLSQVNDDNRYRFDQACRVSGIAFWQTTSRTPTNPGIRQINNQNGSADSLHFGRAPSQTGG